MKARILYIDTETVWRGGQEQLFSLVVGLRDRGYQVALAAPITSPLAVRARSQGIVHYPFEQRAEVSLAACVRLFQIMRQQPFDCVHFNTPHPVIAGSCASFLAGVPRRVSSRRVNFPLGSSISRFKYNWFLDGIVTVSVSIRETLINGGIRPELIHVIYEGVDLNWIDSLVAPGYLTQVRGLKVGIVAHLSPEKGHRTLLQAATDLKDEFPDVKYILIGEGELLDELVEDVRRLGMKHQVIFTGFRTDSEALMKELDIFCLPSLSEGLSSAILCAMANSLPVVATNVGGIPELVSEGETGFLIPPGDSSVLAETLRKLLTSERLRNEMGRAGRKRIEAYFTVSRKLDRSEGFYADLLARG